MERNEETLTTRDLASPRDPAAATTTEPGTGAREGYADAPGQALDRDAASEGGGGYRNERHPYGADAGGSEPAGATGSSEEQAGLAPAGAERPQPARQPSAGGGIDAGQGAAPEDGVPAGSAAGSDASAADASTPLLSEELSGNFQGQWDEIQTRFVDEPRGAVEEADGLVANLMQQLAHGFAEERERLEAQWGRGEDISTEDLRVALQRYRSFFRRLLST